MANLLDRSSLVLTPTAYNNGEALCIKPDDASGDFQFSRNSAATRVNAQGLVENVQILSSNLVQNPSFSEEGVQEVSNGSFSQEGSEEITNGDFSNGSTDWTLGTGWSVLDGKAVFIGSSSGQYLVQNNVYTPNSTIKLTFDVLDYVSGAVRVIGGGFYISGVWASGSISSNGTHTFYIDTSGAANNNIYIQAISGVFNGSITNISIKEVGQDWILGGSGLNTPTIGSNSATITSVDSNSYIQQNGILTFGKSYKISYEILSSSGSNVLKMVSSLGLATIPTTVGTHTVYGTATTTTFYIERMANGMNATITNISVKEVGMDWALGSFTSIGNNVANIVNSTGELSLQQNIGVSQKTIKLTYTISNYASGAIRPQYGAVNGLARSANGTYTEIITGISASSNLAIFSVTTNTTATITNISVIEITSDTNLPRINYEGFSYQDALGSEEIVNGGFDDGSTGWSVGANSEINNGSARIYSPSGSYTFVSQSNVLTVGKTYLISLEIVEQNLGEIRLSDGIGYLSNSFSGVGVHTFKSTSIGTIFRIQRTASITDIRIDNVSVKEVLGQEVVPDSGCGSWLWEPQSTNLITQSELFSDASWADVGLTINNNASVSPEGVFNATKIIATTANSRHELKTSLATANGTDMVSCFVKKSGYNYVQIASWANPANYVNFDLTNGSVGSIGTTPPTNYGIKDYGNGWYRIYANVQASGGGLVGIGIVTSASAGWAQSFIGNGIDGIEIWGAQIEAGNISSYIPTSGSTVTRNQETCINATPEINSEEGVLYFEASSKSDSLSKSITLFGQNANDRVEIKYRPNNTSVQVNIFSSGSLVFNVVEPLAIESINKIAVKYKQNDFALWINGIEVATDTSGNTPTGLVSLNFDVASGNHFYGNTKDLQVYTKALSDAELIKLTT